MFIPLETDRLLIRAAVETDVEALHARRGDSQVAMWQNWTLPWPIEKAQALIEGVMEMDGPANDEWWMAIVTLKETEETLGDLAVFLSFGGRVAEIGYTLASEHWSKGYAVEAVEALIPWLFEDVGVKRIMGMIHPENVASAQVLERTGFVHEGITRQSYWVGDDGSDDWIYGLLPEDWEAWKNRPRHTPEKVELVAITPQNAHAVYRLKPHRSQWRFVAPMEWSFADALIPEIYKGGAMVPWMRAVEADGELVAFVMLALVTDHHPEPYLWRLMVDRLHQRRGIGGRILGLIEEECRSRGWNVLTTSWGEGRGSPRPFYERHGFVPTGEIEDDETVARKELS